MQFPNVGKCGIEYIIGKIILRLTNISLQSRDGVIVLVYLYCTRVRVLFEYSYSSMKESNRTRTRVHYQSNRTHDYFSRLHFFHMNNCKQIIFACLIYYIRQIKMAILEVI